VSSSVLDVPTVAVVDSAEIPGAARSRRARGIAVGILGLICLAMGIWPGVEHRPTLELSSITDAVTLPAVPLPVRGVCLGAGLLCLVGAGILLAVRVGARFVGTVLVLGLVLLVLAFLAWSASGQAHGSINLAGLISNTVVAAVPLALGALAGVLCERSGVVNVAIEGQMLAGAFAGGFAGSVAMSTGAGYLVAAASGAVVGLLLAVLAIRYAVNQVILGVVLNLLVLGLTTFAYNALPRSQGTPPADSPIAIPLLDKIPVIGPPLFDASKITYLTYVALIVLTVGLTRTRWGLRTRAVGEHPRAADAAGIRVLRIRYVNVVCGGALAGLGGASLTVGAAIGFIPNDTAGRGFIALAAVIFGGWRPLGAVGASLFFAFAVSLQTVLTIVTPPIDIPSQVFAALPYLATIFAVAGLVGRVRAPAADGVPYRP
jgi:ABC-type uncharacterized transport system permease subunit